MKTHSKKFIHLGINFIISPQPVLSKRRMLAFQQAILNNGLEYSGLKQKGDRIILIRETPSPLNISVISSNQAIGQIIVTAPKPKSPLSLFIKEARAGISAFKDVWGTSNLQVIGGDATFRELNETASQHAFQELWESRLGQQAKSLAVFGRPLRGGGLRFVLDPQPNDIEASQVEVRIESFLGDSTKIYVEVQSRWRYPQTRSSFDVEEKLNEVNTFLEEKVHRFITGENNNNE